MARKPLLGALLASALAVASADPVGATTLRRMGLAELVKTNESVVVARALDAHSYWNAGGTFILTDWKVAVDTVLKGDPALDETTFTLMGGSIGDMTTLIVGGAELMPGGTYLLFLSPSDLPGAEGVLSVRDHCQAAFDVVPAKEGVRALSQARSQPLLSDDRGIAEPPGGQEGLPFDYMIREISRLAGSRR